MLRNFSSDTRLSNASLGKSRLFARRLCASHDRFSAPTGDRAISCSISWFGWISFVENIFLIVFSLSNPIEAMMMMMISKRYLRLRRLLLFLSRKPKKKKKKTKDEAKKKTNTNTVFLFFVFNKEVVFVSLSLVL